MLINNHTSHHFKNVDYCDYDSDKYYDDDYDADHDNDEDVDDDNDDDYDANTMMMM